MRLFDKNWESPTSAERLSTVFAERNQNYGAYALRKDYDEAIMRAFVITISAGILLTAAPIIKSYYFSDAAEISTGSRDIVVEMVTPNEPIKPEDPIKQDNNQKPAESNTIRDITPVVVNHPTTDTVRTQSDLSSLNTGLTTTNTDSTNKITTGPEDTKKENDKSGFVFHGWVEVMPAFPGGEMEMMKYLSKNLKYPEKAKDADAQGTVLISFIVDKEGLISNPIIKRSIGFGCEEEAIRVIEKMPAWSPGKMNGQTVNVEYVLPIRFTLR